MGIQSINDIVNDLPFKKNYNVNVGSRKTPAEVDQIIDKVCEMISSTDSRAFYCKAAYKLYQKIKCMCAQR